MDHDVYYDLNFYVSLFSEKKSNEIYNFLMKYVHLETEMFS